MVVIYRDIYRRLHAHRLGAPVSNLFSPTMAPVPISGRSPATTSFTREIEREVCDDD